MPKKKKPITNPNGANQFQLDPRQKLCWDLYINPKSKTFGNATQSAVKAGYEYDYADQITTVEWFKGKLRRLQLLDKAEKVLDKTLTYEPEDEEGKVKTDLLRIQTDVAKFVAQTQGKDDGYSTRSEITGKGGEALVNTETLDKATKAINDYLGNITK
jgi:phage terminase small subunit